VVVFGIDTLVGENGLRVLSEINTLNVGGFIQAEQTSGERVISRAAQLLWEYLLMHSQNTRTPQDDDLNQAV